MGPSRASVEEAHKHVRVHADWHCTLATVGSRPGTAGEFCAQKKAFFLPRRNGFEAQALISETGQPPSASSLAPYPCGRVRGASSDFFFAVRTLGTGEPQTTSADWFGAHPELKLPFLGGDYSM